MSNDYFINDILAKGTVGTSVPIPAQSNATVIQVSGDDSVVETLNITLVPPPIQDILANNSFLTNGQFSAHALIQFGVDGIQSSFETDFVRGLAFSIPASFVRVIAFNDNPVGGTAFNFGAFISLKTLGNPLPPTRTITTNVLSNTLSGNVNIPAYASTYTVQRGHNNQSPSQMDSFLIQFFSDNQGNLHPILETIVIGSNQICPILPIPNGALVYQITNLETYVNNGVATPFNTVFNLSI